MKIVTVSTVADKARIIEEVLADLPEWFGLPESTRAYIQDGSALPLGCL